MDSSLYVGLSRQVVLRRAMDMSANNIANAQTPGYRSQNPMFKEYISDPKGAKEPLSLVQDQGQYDTITPGPTSFTGGTYDVALSGPGFMNVKTVSGEIMYSRAGNFTTDRSGMLITSTGLQVGGTGGTPIIVPEGTKEVKILEDGSVNADGNVVGQIGVTEFANLQDLEPEGNGLYSSKTQGSPATETTMKQGMIEGSNVNSVVEMTRMIEISRNYEQTMTMLKNESDRETGAIQRLGKINGQ